jgi:hypothetical protein
MDPRTLLIELRRRVMSGKGQQCPLGDRRLWPVRHQERT